MQSSRNFGNQTTYSTFEHVREPTYNLKFWKRSPPKKLPSVLTTQILIFVKPFKKGIFIKTFTVDPNGVTSLSSRTTLEQQIQVPEIPHKRSLLTTLYDLSIQTTYI